MTNARTQTCLHLLILINESAALSDNTFHIIGIKHDFSLPSPEGDVGNRGRGLQHLPRNLAIANVLENNVNEMFAKIFGKIWHYILSPFGRERVSANIFNIHLPAPRASSDSRNGISILKIAWPYVNSA